VDVFLRLEVDHNGPTVYNRDLEPLVLSESEVFYQGEGERLLGSCDAPEYLLRVSSSSFVVIVSEFFVGPGSLRIRRIPNASLLVLADDNSPPTNTGE
jgi:hypothetical protein